MPADSANKPTPTHTTPAAIHVHDRPPVVDDALAGSAGDCAAPVDAVDGSADDNDVVRAGVPCDAADSVEWDASGAAAPVDNRQ